MALSELTFIIDGKDEPHHRNETTQNGVFSIGIGRQSGQGTGRFDAHSLTHSSADELYELVCGAERVWTGAFFVHYLASFV